MRLAWRMLRQRPTSALATFIALWFGVAVVTACGVLLESGLRYHGQPARYAASTVLVATPQLRLVDGHGDDRDVENMPLPERGRLPASLVPRIAALPSVRTAVADVATPVQVSTSRAGAAAQVHPWSAAVLAPFTLRSGVAPAGGDQVVLEASTASALGAHPGGTVRVTLPDGVRTFTVSGIAAPTGAEPDDATVFVTDAEARAVAGRSTVDVVGVIGGPDGLAREIAALLPDVPKDGEGAFARVYSGADRGLVETPQVADARELAVALPSVFGGVTIFIAALVIAGTVGLSVQQRHRDIALLRAIAATPRQVRRMVVRQTAVLALLAGASGVWAGFAGVRWLRDQFVRRDITPDSFTVRVSWVPPLVAGGIGLLIAVVAAWVASLRASRIRPTEALVESAVERRSFGVVRAVLGLVALAGGVTLSIVSMRLTGDNAAGVAVGLVAALVTAVWLVAPWLNRAAAALAGPVLGRFGVTGQLAAANAAASARRLAPVLSALVLAVGLGGSMWFMSTSIEHRAAQQARAGLSADYGVTPAGPGLPSGLAAALRETPGVTAATGVVRSTMLGLGGRDTDYSAQGLDGSTARTLDLDVTSGSLAGLRGNAVAIDRLTADTLHLRVGDDLHGWFADGAVASLRVVAVYQRGLGFAAVTLPAATLRPHTSGLDDAVLVSGRADLAPLLGRLAPGASVMTRDGYRTALDKNLAENTWANQVVVGVLLVYVVIAAINTLAMAAMARRRELATLRLVGTTRQQILRMVRLEQVLLLAVGLVLGGAVAAATLVPMVKGLTGSPVPYIPPAGWVAVIGGTVLLGTVATLVPIRRVLRVSPVEAIGIRE